MPTTRMAVEERALRRQLDQAVQQVRSALDACPFVDTVDQLSASGFEAAAAGASEAHRALSEALTYTEALEQLRFASEEAVVLCATSRTALGVVREVLTVLDAAIDCRRAA